MTSSSTRSKTIRSPKTRTGVRKRAAAKANGQVYRRDRSARRAQRKGDHGGVSVPDLGQEELLLLPYTRAIEALAGPQRHAAGGRSAIRRAWSRRAPYRARDPRRRYRSSRSNVRRLRTAAMNSAGTLEKIPTAERFRRELTGKRVAIGILVAVAGIGSIFNRLHVRDGHHRDHVDRFG